MNTQSDVISDFPAESRAVAPAVIPAGRLFYWSVRRELWENRSIYIAPLAVAALFLFGFFIGMLYIRHQLLSSSSLLPMEQQKLLQQPYDFAPLLLMGATFIVSIFYCLDALYGERRDRSILFWKSLPVSDLMTVLSKASIPVFVLPLLTFAITIVTQTLMLFLMNAELIGTGFTAATLGFHVSFFPMSVMLLWHLLAIHGLWYAPIYCWMLLISAWARRTPFLWAVLPPLAISVAEKIAFRTSYFAAMLQNRFSGGPEGAAFTGAAMSMDSLHLLSPGSFLASTGLWIGLAVSAVLLAAAVRLRQYRSPI